MKTTTNSIRYSNFKILETMFLQFTDINTGEIFRCTCADVELHYIERVNKKLAAWCKGRTIKRENSNSSFPGLTLSEFKQELRLEDYKGDRWGVAMGAFFDLCAVLYTVGDVPHEWEYRPGVISDLDDDQSWMVELFKQCTVNQLLEIGWFLHRLTGFLRESEYAY